MNFQKDEKKREQKIAIVPSAAAAAAAKEVDRFNASKSEHVPFYRILETTVT